MLTDWRRRFRQDCLEQRCARSLSVCNAHGLFNLPCRNENRIDINSSGELLLCANRSCFCIVNIASELYSERSVRRRGVQSTPCSCSAGTGSTSSPAPCDTLLTKEFSYKAKCSATLWYPADSRLFLSAGDSVVNVWDLSIPEIAHTFNVRLSAVKKLAVPRPGGDSPVIVAGLACGSISTCDMRTGTSFNYRHSAVTGEVTALSFQPHDANRVVVGYEDSSACVWDLRRYSKPLAALGSGGDVDRRAVVQGCSVAYADAGVMSLPGSELPVSLSQDFVNEDDVWSYVMCAAKQPGSTGSGAVCGKVASGIDNGDDPAGISVNNAVDPFAGMKVAKASVLPLDKPPPKGKRARSTVSVTDLLTGGTPLPSPAASSQRPKPRAAKPTSGAGTISSLFSKYKITDHRRRLYSGPDPVSTPATPSAPSGGPIPAPRPTPTRKERLPKFKSRGIPTAFECTPDGTDLFVARHKGHVEQYDGRNYRLVRHFDVDALTRPYQAGEPKGFAQRMRLLALADDSCVLFNVREQLAVLDVRRGALRSAVALQWESHEALVDAGPHQPADAAPAAQKYVTDFTALRGRRDVYALNERGELFVVHPDKRAIFRGHRTEDGERRDDPDDTWT